MSNKEENKNETSQFFPTHPSLWKKKKSVMAFQIFGATDMKSCTTFCFAFVVFVCFFIIAIIILTTVKQITEVSAEHPAETCLGQQ